MKVIPCQIETGSHKKPLALRVFGRRATGVYHVPRRMLFYHAPHETDQFLAPWIGPSCPFIKYGVPCSRNKVS